MSLPSITTHIHAIIFDHDGTLVDSEGVHCKCWNDVLKPYAATLTYSDYCHDYNGLPTRETAQRILEKYNIPLAAEALYSAKIEALNTRLRQAPFPLLPSVLETLDSLHSADIPLAVASGANRSEVEHSLTAHKLKPYFQAVTTKHDVANSKPAPDVYLLAAKQLGVPPENCLAIEDSDTGETSAASAGMACIRLTATPSAPHHCANMAEAYSLIKKMLS